MTHSMDFTAKNLHAHIFRQMTALEKDASLLDCLIAMQTAEGIDEATASANAAACILASAAREAVHTQISENAAGVMNALLTDLAKLEEPDRLLALHKILFGLTAYEDADTARELEQGAIPDQLFQAYYDAQINADAPLTAAEVEEQIRRAIARYSLSPVAMRMLTRKMRRNDGYLATAEALGAGGRNLKCLMTMEVWLRNPDVMTMEEAANIAATSVETQAVADAVQRGYIARDVAKKLLIVIGIAVAVFGMIYMVQSMPMVADALAKLANVNPTGQPMSPLLKSFLEKQFAARHSQAIVQQALGAVMTLGGTAMAVLSDRGAELVGTITAGFTSMLRKSADAPAADLESLAGREIHSVQTGFHEEPVVELYDEAPAEEEAPDFTFF